MTGPKASDPYGPFTGASHLGEMETETVPVVVSGGYIVGLAMPQAARTVPGRDTVTFPAIRDNNPDECKCGTRTCPDRDRTQDPPMPTDTRALLSCGPGVASKMWRERVRNGQWDDIPALFLKAAERVEGAADRHQVEIHNNLDCDWHDIAAVFRANTALLTDPLLGQSLRGMEDVLARRLEDDRRRSAERWGNGRAA